MDLTTMTVIDLKAAVYDQMVVAEQAQKNIQILNQEITARLQVPAQPKEGVQNGEIA